VSQITIHGLDIVERSGSYRVRARVYPFFTLSETFDDELKGSIWGCQQLQRLQGLHAQLQREGRLPTKQLTRVTAVELGLHDLIEPPVTKAHSDIASKSIGDEIHVYEVLDSYVANEATRLSAGYKSRANRLKDYFGDTPISAITTSSLEEYIDARKAGKLGSGRSEGAAYATKNRLDQANRRRKKNGIPVVKTATTCTVLPSTGTVRHELKVFRQALRAYVNRDDARRQRIGAYVMTHPIVTIDLPPPSGPRKRRISDEELRQILLRVSCPAMRTAIMLAIYTSLRRAEIVSLRAEDIDFSASTIGLRAPQEPDPLNPGSMRKRKKSKTHDRDVPLVPEALELLRSYCHGKFGPIFDFKAASLSQAFGRAAEIAGLKNVRLHDGRREALSRLHDDYGLSLEQLKVFSGHGDIKTLETFYFQPSASKLANLIAKARAAGGRVAA
jgi:integrase